MKNIFRFITICLTRLVFIPLLLTAVWNSIAWEFNLPTYGFWFFCAISCIYVLCKLSKTLYLAFLTDDEV